MSYSKKMKIASTIAMAIGIAFIVISFAYFMLQFINVFDALIDAGIDPLIYFWSFIILLIAIASIAIGVLFLERGLKNLIKNTQTFRSKINYCYSCSTSLKEATTADICPNCGSKLNLLDVIDIEEI